MADNTLIEWTDATWNIVTGCSVVSPGCTNCYAMRLAGTRMRNDPTRRGLTTDSKAGPVWNGQVRFNEHWLTQPLRWTKPRRIFVAAHGDLFHDGVTDAWLDRIFAVMALCPQHTFQVLTKRPERMRDYLQAFVAGDRHVFGEARELRPGCQLDVLLPEGEEGEIFEIKPLPNVWLGVSVEDLPRAHERVPVLLDTPAAIRWLSAEPLLGELGLRCIPWSASDRGFVDALTGETQHAETRARYPDRYPAIRGLDWIVVGGESAPRARPMHPDWVRRLRDQCADAGVPFLFKQWGAWAEVGDPSFDEEVEVGTADADAITDCVPADRRGWVNLDGRTFYGHPDNLPEGRWRFVERVGKTAAGRTLDCHIHDGFPA